MRNVCGKFYLKEGIFVDQWKNHKKPKIRTRKNFVPQYNEKRLGDESRKHNFEMWGHSSAFETVWSPCHPKTYSDKLMFKCIIPADNNTILKTLCLTSPLKQSFFPPFRPQTKRGCDTHRQDHPSANALGVVVLENLILSVAVAYPKAFLLRVF